MTCNLKIGPYDCCSVVQGDCLELMKAMPDGCVDAVITDPPYGIDRANGMGGQGYDGFGRGIKRQPREYPGDWDFRPDGNALKMIVARARISVIWGGNYFTDALPVGKKWLIWDKQQTMPSFSDVELAWTNLAGIALKMFRYCGAGLMALEQDRYHPTQKPIALMKWCIEQAGHPETILDPFAGSGSTLVAAKNLGRHFLGFEISAEYCAIARDRIARIEAQPTLFEPKPEQMKIGMVGQ